MRRRPAKSARAIQPLPTASIVATADTGAISDAVTMSMRLAMNPSRSRRTRCSSWRARSATARATKLVVEGGVVADPGRLDDLGLRHRVDAAGGEEPRRGVDQLLSGRLGIGRHAVMLLRRDAEAVEAVGADGVAPQELVDLVLGEAGLL